MSDRKPGPLRVAYEVVRATFEGGMRHNLLLYAPAIAYALVVSFAPLSIALNLIGARASRLDALGPNLPDVTSDQLFGSAASWSGSWSPLVVGLLVIFGASTLFSQLARAIGQIWEQGYGGGGLRQFFRHHLFGFVLLATATAGLFASAIMGNAISVATQLVNGETGIDVSWVESTVGSRVVLDVIFAAILLTVAFTSVPRIRPRVRDVLPGSLMTAGAYAAGQWGLSLYLGTAARFSLLGAFGALLAFLVWAYYTAAIILWGAELTHKIARQRACARGGQDTAAYTCPDRPSDPAQEV
jgi:membrane protein